MARSLETDYLVVGAGAMGMAFTDALIDNADVHVTLVDRRHAAGGHWQDAYPFVRLHQASVFYGVASTVLGTGATQRAGRSRGSRSALGGRRSRATTTRSCIADSSVRVASRSSEATSIRATGPSITSRPWYRVRPRTSTCAAASSTPPTCHRRSPRRRRLRSASAEGVRVVAVNELARLVEAPSSYVIVGSGKTATDGIVWLLANGVDPDRIMWVRPREPWMLNRAVVQPDPSVALRLAAETMAAAAEAESLDDLFLRLEAAGVMFRIDTEVSPTMAKTPTLGEWELDLLRTIENVVRLGHIKHVSATEIVLDDGSFRLRQGRSWCTAPPRGCSTRHWFPSGVRTRSGFKRSVPAFPASMRHLLASWKRPVTMTASETAFVHPTPSPTTLPAGRRCRFVEPWRRARMAQSQTSRTGRTAVPSTRRA